MDDEGEEEAAARLLEAGYAEAHGWEQSARGVWLRVQRESRKDVEDRSRDELTKVVVETTQLLEQLGKISHRIDAVAHKKLRSSWKHCAR